MIVSHNCPSVSEVTLKELVNQAKNSHLRMADPTKFAKLGPAVRVYYHGISGYEHCLFHTK